MEINKYDAWADRMIRKSKEMKKVSNRDLLISAHKAFVEETTEPLPESRHQIAMVPAGHFISRLPELYFGPALKEVRGW